MTTDDRRVRVLLIGAFAAIAALLISLLVLEGLQGADTRRNVELVQGNSLVSIELVGRLANDVERERGLLGEHIIASDLAKMVEIERGLAAVRADFADAAIRYAPLATFPGEAETWQRFTSEVREAERAIEPALALSRLNRDLEAQQTVKSLDPLFERIERDKATLVDINREAGVRAVATVATMQAGALELRVFVTAAILLAILAIGLVLTRMVVRAHREVLVSNRMLENRNRELDAFAGRIAHDLRGPLGTINLSASMLAARAPGGQATAVMLERGVAQITDLIEDLLLLSRVGAMPTAIARPEELAPSLAEDLGRLVSKAGGALHVDLEPAAVSCSATLLRQVLWNLGENAVKYRRADAPPAVDVLGRIDAGAYAIRVADNGVGMTNADAGRAFEPFFRSDKTRSIPGTGLGLAIVRRIVDAAGGTVAIESTPGVGTTFRIELPLGPRGNSLPG